MQDELVMIKGKNDRIEIILSSEYDYFDLKNALYDKLEDISKFLGHSNYKVYVAGKHLTEGQKRELSSVMRREHGLSDVTFCSMAELQRLGQRQQMRSHAGSEWTKVKDDTNRENGSIFKVGNVRGGQQLQANGDITVVGDVNPGAELVAKGNICVMGALRGNAHAGAFGDDKAIIVANILEANQLRISDCIGIAPKDNKSGGSAEVASIYEKRIIIEPLSEKRNKHI